MGAGREAEERFEGPTGKGRKNSAKVPASLTEPRSVQPCVKLERVGENVGER